MSNFSFNVKLSDRFSSPSDNIILLLIVLFTILFVLLQFVLLLYEFLKLLSINTLFTALSEKN
jgi:hypothetical protein